MEQTQREGASMIRRIVVAVLGLAGVGVLLWAFPLFHLVPLETARASKQYDKINAAELASRFWDEELTPALPRAADANAVLATIEKDFQAAREKYGRTVGVSSSYYIFIQGTGRVVKVDSKGVGLAIREGGPDPDVILPLGMIFDNTVRDATGLLDLNTITNSQDANAIAAELNLLVEKRVLPPLRARAKVGLQIRFVGCASVSHDAKRRMPLIVVPLRVDFIEPEQPR